MYKLKSRRRPGKKTKQCIWGSVDAITIVDSANPLQPGGNTQKVSGVYRTEEEDDELSRALPNMDEMVGDDDLDDLDR